MMVKRQELSPDAAARASRHHRRRLVVLTLAAFALGYVLIVRETGGAFGYSLDDPYIHLRLSQVLAHGTYGINLGESASRVPRSSGPSPRAVRVTGAHEYVRC